MPRNSDKMTPNQKAFAGYYAATNEREYSAVKAGYAEPNSAASRALALPIVQAEIRKQQLARLFSEALPAAVQCLVSIVTDSKAPAGARVQASKVIFDRTLGQTDEGQGKEPHEMTSEELAKAIGELERVAFERAKVIQPIEDAQPVRNDDDIFQ